MNWRSALTDNPKAHTYVGSLKNRKEKVMSKLKPCPFCGGSNIKSENYSSQIVMECNDCGGMGPDAELAADPHCDIEAAEEAWNKRAPLDCH